MVQESPTRCLQSVDTCAVHLASSSMVVYALACVQGRGPDQGWQEGADTGPPEEEDCRHAAADQTDRQGHYKVRADIVCQTEWLQ